MAAMLMVLVYNLVDTFFIGQTHNALLVATVSLATPVYLIFMSIGTLFGIGGTSVISRALGEGKKEKARKYCAFCFCGCVFVGILLAASIPPPPTMPFKEAFSKQSTHPCRPL